jgi:hypothetical protein
MNPARGGLAIGTACPKAAKQWHIPLTEKVRAAPLGRQFVPCRFVV